MLFSGSPGVWRGKKLQNSYIQGPTSADNYDRDDERVNHCTRTEKKQGECGGGYEKRLA